MIIKQSKTYIDNIVSSYVIDPSEMYTTDPSFSTNKDTIECYDLFGLQQETLKLPVYVFSMYLYSKQVELQINV